MYKETSQKVQGNSCRNPTTTATTTANEIEKTTSKQRNKHISPSALRTNKNGLPIEVQKEILLNVARFDGYDDFVRDTCDKNIALFGEKGSSRRKACLSKRQLLIDLQLYDTQRFLELCKELGLTTIKKESTISAEAARQLFPTTLAKETTKAFCEQVPKCSTIDNDRSVRMETKGKFSSSAYDHLPSYELNWSKPEQNPNGFLVFKLTSIEFENEVIDAVVLTKLIPDLNDARCEEKIEINLLSCGTKLLFSEPSVSKIMKVRYEQTFFGLARHPFLHRALLTSHQVFLREIEKDHNRKTKKYVLCLPPGSKCKMGYMNPASGSRIIGIMNCSITRMEREVTNLRTDFDVIHPSMTFSIALDADVPKFIREDPNIHNEFDDFFGRMNMNA